MWDLVTRSCVAKLAGHFSAVTSLALSPDGWQLLSGGRDKVVCVWDLRTNSRTATVPVYEAVEGLAALPPGGAFPGVEAGAGGVGAAAGGRGVYFATAGERGQVRLWRSDTAQCVYTQRRGGGGASGSGGLNSAVAAGKKKKGASAAAAGGGDDEGPPPAGAELTDLQLLPGGKGLMASTGDARLLLFAPEAAAAAALPGGVTTADGKEPGKGGKGAKASAAAAASGAHGAASDRMVLFKQLVGNQDEVTDLAFLGKPNAPPARLAVATNAAEVRLYSVGTLACDASCVGHRWVWAWGPGERGRGLVGAGGALCPRGAAGRARAACQPAGPAARVARSRDKPRPAAAPPPPAPLAAGTSSSASTPPATRPAACCWCLAPRTARRARGAARPARASASRPATCRR